MKLKAAKTYDCCISAGGHFGEAKYCSAVKPEQPDIKTKTDNAAARACALFGINRLDYFMTKIAAVLFLIREYRRLKNRINGN